MKITDVLAVIIAVIVLFAIFGSCGDDNSDDRDVATCKGCGTSYYAGDAAGNYMNIGWTNLCNRCEAEAKAYGELKDYLELN